jgi:hypothetical protein
LYYRISRLLFPICSLDMETRLRTKSAHASWHIVSLPPTQVHHKHFACKMSIQFRTQYTQRCWLILLIIVIDFTHFCLLLVSNVRFVSTNYTSWRIVLLPCSSLSQAPALKSKRLFEAQPPAELLILTSPLVAIDFHALLLSPHLPTGLFYLLLAYGNPLHQTTNLIMSRRIIHPSLSQVPPMQVKYSIRSTIHVVLDTQRCHPFPSTPSLSYHLQFYTRNVTTVSIQFACVSQKSLHSDFAWHANVALSFSI